MIWFVIIVLAVCISLLAVWCNGIVQRLDLLEDSVEARLLNTLTDRKDHP